MNPEMRKGNSLNQSAEERSQEKEKGKMIRDDKILQKSCCGCGGKCAGKKHKLIKLIGPDDHH
jgi:hypothetical protein